MIQRREVWGDVPMIGGTQKNPPETVSCIPTNGISTPYPGPQPVTTIAPVKNESVFKIGNQPKHNRAGRARGSMLDHEEKEIMKTKTRLSKHSDHFGQQLRVKAKPGPTKKKTLADSQLKIRRIILI